MRRISLMPILLIIGAVLLLSSLFRRNTLGTTYQPGGGIQPTNNSTVNSILAGINGLAGIFSSIWNSSHQNTGGGGSSLGGGLSGLGGDTASEYDNENTFDGGWV